jgi:hypothetical protein
MSKKLKAANKALSVHRFYPQTLAPNQQKATAGVQPLGAIKENIKMEYNHWTYPPPGFGPFGVSYFLHTSTPCLYFFQSISNSETSSQ